MAETIELYTVDEAARLLRVNPITVRRYIAAGKLRAVRIGKGIRIGRDALDELATPIKPKVGLPAERCLSYEDPLWHLVGSATDAPPTDAARTHAYLDEDRA